MSRRLLIAALFTCAFSSVATADRIDSPNARPRFAAPPPAASTASITSAEAPRPDIAPDRVLDRAALRKKLLANRAANLARFRAYQAKGMFPNNTYTTGKLNVWLDEYGNLCAAATIMKMSGQDDLVARVAEQNNFIRLADVEQGPVMDWILTSGLTQAEIVAIQEPMMSIIDEPQPAPIAEPPVIVASKRKAEDKRLMAKYRQVDAMIVKHEKRSIELAVDRLMKRPDLAWQLLDS